MCIRDSITPFRNILNEMYAADISVKIKSAYRARFQQGKFMGTTAPYGYIKDPADHNHLLIDDKVAHVVKEIFDLALKGNGVAKICRHLNKPVSYTHLRADFNSNRRFYRWTNDVAEYLEDMAGRERQAEVGTVAELLEEIESENLYQVLVTVDGRTLKIVLLKMQGYSTKEIAPLVHLTTGAIYARLDHLRKKLRKIL